MDAKAPTDDSRTAAPRPPENLALARRLVADAIEQIEATPEATRGWHLLAKRLEAASDPESRRWCAAQLDARLPSTGLAGFMKEYFVALATGAGRRLHDAAGLLLAVEPLHAERLIAFAGLEWGRHLLGTASRPEFVGALRTARIPEIVARIGSALAEASATELPARVPCRLERVAVVTPTIAHRSHTPTTLTVEHANLLRSRGLAVELFSCQETSVEDMQAFLPNGGSVVSPHFDAEELGRRLAPGTRAHVSNPRFSLMRRWRDMVGMIGRFDPDAVLFVGLYSPLVVPLFARRPVLGLSINAIAPISPVHAWLCASEGDAGRASDTWAPTIPPAWGIRYPYRIGAIEGRTRVPRDEIGLDESAVVLVSVGYRLAREIGGEWARRMARFLLDHPGCVWLLVGVADSLLPVLADLPAGRVIVLPHRDDVRGILPSCDVYVNPPRMGGGFSVAEAMAEGLPVVAYADSDGGDKAGAAAVAGDKDYFARLAALVGDPQLRRAAGEAMRARFDESLSLAKAASPLADALEQTLARFARRVH